MKYFYILLLMFFIISNSFSQNLTLVDNNQSNFVISIGANADDDEILASNILQKYLLEISNVKVPIMKGEINKSKMAIYVAKDSKIADVSSKTTLDEDGYAIKSTPQAIWFLGGNKKGIVYAVYSFLESFLDCRMYTPYSKVIPKKNKIIIPANLNIAYNPKLKHRQYWFFGSFVPNAEFLLWHKLDNYKSDMDWGSFMMHTYRTYLPQKINLKSNPDFFALIKGKRDSSQLDYSNPKLLDYVVKNLSGLIRSNNKTTWAINPNDNERYCECSKCTAVNVAEGTKMGSLLKFVNQVAKNFPEKEFSTVAYLSTQTPPAKMIPRENVRVILCNMGNVLNVPMNVSGASSVNDAFKLKMLKWKSITKKLLIWDYQALFKNIYIPFPNLYNMSADIRFYASNGISGMFIEGDGGLKASFSDAKIYLAAKLMWNPDVDESEILKEFFQWRYGAASSNMLLYYNTMNNNFIKSSEPINCMSEVSDKWSNIGYFKPQMISNYRDVLDKGIASVKGNKGVISNIKFELMGLNYFELELMKKNITKYSKNDINQKVDSFFRELDLQKIKVANYYLTPIDTYKQQTSKILNYKIQK